MSIELRDFVGGSDFCCNIVIRERDIEDDSNWYETFREYVPVLVVGGEEVCPYFLDRAELHTAIIKEVKRHE
ncbi:MAG: hypothetical protein GKR96_09590 [Gammaproteobacteria bacterium]|nr:hypothetical protein [Gammaproteobacteria bacterium]